MPLRDYVRSVRGAFHRESAPASSSVSAGDGEASDCPRWTLKGDLPSDKLFIPDGCLETLASTTFRPHDKMTGVVRAQHGALGDAEGFSVVKATLYVNVRLVQTSKQGSYLGNVLHIGDTMIPVSSDYDIDTFEDRLFEVAETTLYNYDKEGKREGKEVDLHFELPIPPEAGGFQLAPSLAEYM